MARILMIDDQHFVRRVVLNALRADGHQITVQNDADLVHQRIKSEKPQLVIIDKLANSFDCNQLMFDIKKEYPTLPVCIYFLDIPESILELTRIVRQAVVLNKFKNWRRLKIAKTSASGFEE